MGYMLNIGMSVDSEDYEEFLDFVGYKLELLRMDLRAGKTSGSMEGTHAGAKNSFVYRVDTNPKCYKVRVWEKNYEDVLVHALNPIEARNVASTKYEEGKIAINHTGAMRSFDTELATYEDTLNMTFYVFRSESVDKLPVVNENPKEE